MPQQKLCAVSVDLDPLAAYYHIHGLGDPPKQVRHTIMKRVLPRFGELFEAAEVPATMFVVGRTLESSQAAQDGLRALAQAGHEIANHTYSHPYDLCRLPENVIEQEISKAHDVVARTIGEEHAPVGFRSPGYFINGRVLQVLTGAGYRYDSSMFPSPPYWFAKVAVMGGMAVRGRRSASVLTDPRGLTAPLDPYRPHYKRPWTRGDAPLIELPVTVLPHTRVPVIGTLFAAGPKWLQRYALDAVRKLHFFNFELHGIDLADAVDDSIPTELAGRQPDLRIPFVEKRRIFLDTIRTLKRDFRFVTLAEAAQTLEAEV